MYNSTNINHNEMDVKNIENCIQDILFKCKNDPCYFISSFCVRPDNINEKIDVYKRSKQKEIINTYLENHFVLINSSRQVGKTTLIEALILWHVLFFQNYDVAILSKNGEFTVKIISEIMVIYDNLPTFFKKLVYPTIDNARTKVFSNYSKIESIIVEKNKPENAGRGCRGGFVFIDEAAFIEYMDIIYPSLEPITSSKHKEYEKIGYPYGIIVSSTPNGVEGLGRWFFEQQNLAQEGLSRFKYIRFHWSDAGYTQDEMLKKRINLNNDLKYMQEYELVFLVGQDSLLDADTATQLQKKNSVPKFIYKTKYNYLCSFYDDIKKDCIYLIGIDSASETGTSDQAFLVCEYDQTNDIKLRTIAEGACKIPIISFVDSIIEIVDKFFKENNNYILIIERNYLGESIIDTIRKNRDDIYAKIYMSTVKKGKETQVIKGIYTTRTKDLMIDSLSQFLTENKSLLDEILLTDKLKRQLLSLQYSRISKKLTVPSNMKDDLVMSFCFILYCMYFDTSNFAKHISQLKLKNSKVNDAINYATDLIRMRYY